MCSGFLTLPTAYVTGNPVECVVHPRYFEQEGRQTGEVTDRKTGRQAGMQTQKQTGRQEDRHEDSQPGW